MQQRLGRGCEDAVKSIDGLIDLKKKSLPEGLEEYFSLLKQKVDAIEDWKGEGDHHHVVSMQSVAIALRNAGRHSEANAWKLKSVVASVIGLGKGCDEFIDAFKSGVKATVGGSLAGAAGSATAEVVGKGDGEGGASGAAGGNDYFS